MRTNLTPSPMQQAKMAHISVDQPSTHSSASAAHFNPAAITRPAPQLLWYYILVSALTLFVFPFVFIPLYLRFRTLRFRFDEDGISISQGMLFKKEVNLTYRRIQDIHVTRNIFQRWMGLATIEIQTASGSASAEATIEGVLKADALRDFLYTKMRGARGDGEGAIASESEPGGDVVLGLLIEIRDQIRELGRTTRPAAQTQGTISRTKTDE